MKFHLKVWRQKDPSVPGNLEDYEADNIPEGASFLEMLDIVNSSLTGKNIEPIQFDSDCREGICGTCSLTINENADPRVLEDLAAYLRALVSRGLL